MKRTTNINESEKIFFSISEVSSMLDIPAYVLRFWEKKFNAISPVKRSSGKRFYKNDDILVIKVIKDLLYKEGYTIKGAEKILKKKIKEEKAKQEPEKHSSSISSADEIFNEIMKDETSTIPPSPNSNNDTKKDTDKIRLSLQEILEELDDIEEELN